MPFLKEKFATDVKERAANRGSSDLFLNPSSIAEGGSVRISPLGDSALDCYEIWGRRDGKPTCLRFSDSPTDKELQQRATDEAVILEDKDGKPTKIKPALAFFVWEYESSTVKLFYAAQSTIVESLAGLFMDEDVANDPTAWDFQVERTGKGLDTRYTVMLKPGKRKGAVKAEVEAAWAECVEQGWNLEALLVNGDPTKPAGGLY